MVLYIFKRKLLNIIGMIHVNALPGTPKCRSTIQNIVCHALKEAEIYIKSGVDGILVENMHDIPYLQPPHIGPEVTAAMTRICSEIRKVTPPDIPCGVQVLAAANKEALAVAQSAEFQFIRCEGFVFSHIADEGWTNSCAAELLRYRKSIDCESIAIFTDIKKKHAAHALTRDVDISETAAAAEFFLSDGLVITGSETGAPANVDDLESVRQRTTLPVMIGSGVTLNNVKNYLSANALIIGSHFKHHGRWSEDLDSNRIQKFMATVGELRKTLS